MSVLIVGSSHIRWLEKFLLSMNCNNNFNLQPQPVINFNGISGGKLCNADHVRRFERSISLCKPTYLIIQVGGNDLDSSSVSVESVELMILQFVSLCTLFQSRYNILKIIVLQLLPRPSPRYLSAASYQYFVKYANRILKRELSIYPSIVYWKIKRVKNPASEIFKDGVHFNSTGMKKYYNNIRGAVIKLLRS